MLDRYRLIPALSAALLAAACGSSGPVVTPAELVEFKPSASPKVLWRGSVAAADRNTFSPQVAGGLVYAPHTAGGYRLPASRLLFHAGAALVTTRGLRSARRAGFV